ncbi:MAG: DUF420 domain-containing protein [Firmicutes bacterium]|uniref:DUF420 domain-containing protein n=1 Tax=Geochorda subterranea TaxID=3109564 RepID=A0ABZ1BK23_9FIRM|nr:DUF420 domain-containing protein [Limnochorda sp. LNt]NLG69101.1 DUF420 domain-containing protein [Bacillota bacterium]WRP13247.1 DUF420 domain-containing protein [Limnochorda sp. LNt]
MDVPLHPTLNALLNLASAVCLVAGYVSIRRRQVARHRAWMLGAFGASTAFLVSYLIYHARVGSVPFAGPDWARPVYFFFLITHSVLAALVLPMALATLYHALKGRYAPHRRIARWTWPIWMYVSVTGAAVVYVMLYILFPSHGAAP